MEKAERPIIIFVVLLLPILILTNSFIFGHGDEYDDDDEHEMEEFLDPRREGRLGKFRPKVEPVVNQVYIQECTDCHMAYSPNLLPKRSWAKMMETKELENHFEEYLAIDEVDRSEISRYLQLNSADTSGSKLAQKIRRSVRRGEAPLRISTLREIEEEHEDIPNRYIKGNAKVLSLSQCSACHQQVDKGIYDEDDVFIPYEKLVKK